jgi:hypothetical protein
VDIYTLEDESLGRDQVIDEYESLIWTERHIDPGEVRLVLPATEFNYQLIKPGTLLAHENSQELMLIDTRSVRDEDGMITNSGKSLETFLDERYNDAFEATDTPAGIMGQIVQSMIDRYEYMTGPGDVEVPSYLPGLMVGYLEPGDGQYVTEKVEYGPTYTNLMKIAQKYGLNFGLYRVSNDIGSWDLHFSVHMGKDRTSEQTANKVVRFSPDLDSLGNVEEVTSDAGFKSVVIALPPKGMEIQMDKFSLTPDPIKVSRVANGDTNYQPWRERVLEITCDDIKMDDLGPDGTSGTDQLARLYEIMEARARRKLRKQQRPDMVSGEITPDAQYKYKADAGGDPGVTTYELGDRVEFGGHFGEVRQGSVTEYVRSQDNTGGRSYPTVSEKAIPVLQQGYGELVLAWETNSDVPFWGDPDLSSPDAIPQFWKALEGERLLPGQANLTIPPADMIKFRWRWGNDPDDRHYREYAAPDPYRPPASTEVQVTGGGGVDIDGDIFMIFSLESTAGGDFGFWMPDEEAWYIYADHAGEAGDALDHTTYPRFWTDRMLQNMGVEDPDFDPGTGHYLPGQEAWSVNGWSAITAVIPITISDGV